MKSKSPLKKWIDFCGSLKLAMLLLLSLALACAVATITESRFNTRIAQAYIYHAPWFNVWLTILCVNLFCATLTRRPWRRKHFGFVITHFGIITLLIGALIGRLTGFEASITLEKGTPNRRLILPESILLVESPRTGELYSLPFDAETLKPTETRPRRLPIPGSDTKLIINGSSKSLKEVSVLQPDPDNLAPAGIALRLKSPMTPTPIDVCLIDLKEQNVFNLFNMASIEWLPQMPPPPEKKGFVENQMIFAKADHPPVIGSSGKPSGYFFKLEPREGKEVAGKFNLLMQMPDKQMSMAPLESVLGQSFVEKEVQIKVVQYWNDLKMVNGAPQNASSEPRNPAVLIQVFPASSAAPLLQLAPDSKGNILFRIQRNGQALSTNTIPLGQAVATGLGPWEMEVASYYPHAKITANVIELTEQTQDPAFVPGLRVQLELPSGGRGQATWIASGTSQYAQNGNKMVRVGYGLRTMQLPFALELKNFEVPRDEGTDEPANFISKVVFHDMTVQQSSEATIEMNQPASYPTELWRRWSGWTYKFSQASWEPGNLNKTSLQVLYDPGWLFKWIGSLMICFGIFTMFYLKETLQKTSPKS